MKKYKFHIIGYIALSLVYEWVTIVTDVYDLPIPHNFFGSIIAYSFVLFPFILGYFLYKRYIKEENKIFMKNWSLSDFTKEYGPKMQIGRFTKITGKSYHRCIFTKENGTQTFVDFFPSLGELSATEISERKKELKVGLTVSKKFFLHNGNVEIWENIQL